MNDPLFDARVAELQASWRVAKSAAQKLGIERQQGQSWEDLAEAIAVAEFESRSQQKPAEESASTLPAIKGRYATEYFKANGIPYCETCGAAYEHAKGNPVCPERLDARFCPRLKPKEA